MTVTNPVSNSVCNGGKGTITISGANGVTPYQYYVWLITIQHVHWLMYLKQYENTLQNSSIVSREAGTYNIYVEDKNGCRSSNSAVVNEPTGMLFYYPQQTNNTIINLLF